MFSLRKKAGSIFGIIILFVVFSAVSLTAQSKRYVYELDGSLQKTYPLKRGGIFSVENVNGQIKVESWNRNEVDIDIRERNRGNSEIEIEIRVSDDRISVRTIHPKRRFYRKSASAHYTIKVPREIIVRAQSTNGSVSVRDIHGEVDAGTTNGGVVVNNVEGDVKAHTTNGDIEVEDVSGIVRAETTNQSIYLRNVDGERVDASTTNGGIRADLIIDPDGRYDFSTTNGSIRVTVPEDSEMDVTAYCKGRSFSSDFDISSRYDRDDRRNSWTSRNIRGKVNGGGASLKMSTTNGRIDLRKR